VIQGIFQGISERKKMGEETRKHSRELGVFYKASAGREGRIIELKKEIEMLRRGSGNSSEAEQAGL
jgi:hypothetical protein